MIIKKVSYVDYGINTKNTFVEKIGVRIIINLTGDSRMVNLPEEIIKELADKLEDSISVDMYYEVFKEKVVIDKRLKCSTIDKGDYAFGLLNDEEIKAIEKWFKDYGITLMEKSEILDEFDIREFDKTHYNFNDEMGYLDKDLNEFFDKLFKVIKR